jgi:hypothetical protein
MVPAAGLETLWSKEKSVAYIGNRTPAIQSVAGRNTD